MKMFRKFLKNKECGNILLTAFLMVILLTIISTAFIASTVSVNKQAESTAYSKKAYYASEAGIEEAAMLLWEEFKLGMMSTKIRDFKRTVDDYNVPSVILHSNPSFGDEGKLSFEVTLERLSADTDRNQVTVRLTSIGRAYIKKGGSGDVFKQKTIVADFNYTLKHSEIFDYAYFGNNFAWQTGIHTGGSIASNGAIYLQNSARVAGGDRYKYSKFDGTNFELVQKIDDGGIYSRTSLFGSRIGYNDMYPSTPNLYDANSAVTFNSGNGIKMPSLADHSYYSSYVQDEETKATNPSSIGVTHYPADNIKDRYGVYVWVPEGTPGRGDDGYIQICDSVYGDETGGSYNAASDLHKCYSKSNGSWTLSAENSTGNLIITDSPDHPIKVYGTVLVKGNLIIRGKIQGTGAIYSGNNTYITGPLAYERAPQVSGDFVEKGYRGFSKASSAAQHRDGDATHSETTAKVNQEKWLKDNKPSWADSTGKDMLGLFAGGSLIIGDAGKNNNEAGARKGIINNIKQEHDGIDWNETDEAKLGTDQVPYTGKSGTLDETWENNNTWDVLYYTSDNKPPLKDPNNPALGYAVNPFTNRSYSYLTDTQKSAWDASASTGGFYETYRNAPASDAGSTVTDCVIPGTGEDLDGDGKYDPKMKPKDALCFTPEQAASLPDAPSNTQWNDALKVKASEWGGTFDLSSGGTTGLSFTNLAVYDGTKCVTQVDPLIYSNHLAGGWIDGTTNGTYTVRIEATSGTSIRTNHDDRVTSGGGLSEMSLMLPVTEVFEVLGWKEM